MPPALSVLLQVPRAGVPGPGDTLSSHDTLAAAVGAVRDTLSSAPLPGGVATILRFLFQVPQWIQIGGAVVVLALGTLLLVWVWKRRTRILNWLRTRSRELQLALAGSMVVLVAVAGFAGKKSWDYMQHENAFCTGCHIMERPFRRFAAGAGRHENLKCHDCHQQSLFASTRQLVLWVAERPEKIGVHASVPNFRCEGCHQVQGGQKSWQHIRRLAGHKVHFESDSLPLQHLTCVKCHGAEVHRFIPSTRACEQSGCHEKQTVKLAGMAKLPEINCVTCHAFRKDLPGLATRDSAVRALVPSQPQCLSCHEMKGRPHGFDLAKDPHRGSCGSCHDVHAHRVPSDARASCTKCHDVARSAFHLGANHRRIQTQCLTCHQPHAASLDASDCVGCHNAVRQRGQFKPPLPFDTSAVLKRKVVPVGMGLSPFPLPTVRDSPTEVLRSDSFPHARHTSLPCLTCHVVNRPGAGLVFQPPRGCDLCHHQNAFAGRVVSADCARCHRSESLAKPMPSVVQVRVGARPSADRTVGFRHERHGRLACADCHRPPDVIPADSVRRCTACHDQHHAATRDCSQCHSRDSNAAHSRATHTGCVNCHTPARIAKLVPTRSLCLTCHTKQSAHLPGRECTICHFLATPEEFRARMQSGAPR